MRLFSSFFLNLIYTVNTLSRCRAGKMERRIYGLIVGVVVFTICVNALVLVWTKNISDNIRSLDEAWRQDAEVVLSKSQLLTQMERHFGYNGFIHHFKNYILRHQTIYFDTAQIEAVELRAALDEFDNYPLSLEEQNALVAIRSTLELYIEKLNFAFNQQTLSQNIAELDEQVKVDDSLAEKAFEVLRRNISLEFIEAQYDQKRLLAESLKQTQLGGWVFMPLLTCVALFNLLALWFCVKLIRERKMLFNATPDAVIYVHDDGQIQQVNQAACDLFGYLREEMLLLKVEQLVPQEYREQHVKDRGEFTGRSRMRRKSSDGLPIIGITKQGSEIPIDVAISSTKIGSHKVNIAVVRDIRKEKRLELEAQNDHLTQVYNRRHLDSVLLEEIERAKRYGRKLSVLLVDLDHFKELNDEHGHLKGDAMLKQLSQFLKVSVRPSDFIGRWGGDEFLLICPETGPDAALRFAYRLVEDFQFLTEGQLTLSVGVAGYDIVSDLISAQMFLDAADKALYKAKTEGRNQAQLFIGDVNSVYS